MSSNRFSSADLPRNISGTSLNSLSSVPVSSLIDVKFLKAVSCISKIVNITHLRTVTSVNVLPIVQ